MPKQSKSLPDSATIVRNYGELDTYATAFAAGHLNLLIISGEAGTGKSRAVRRAVGDDACWIETAATAFGLYRAAYEHRDQPIVIDDIDGLWSDRNFVRLLKSLCQSEPVKTLSWNTAAPALQKYGLPQQFTTASQIAIITNQWKTLSPVVAALEDRGHLIQFAPSALEIHLHAAGWYWCQEIFDFIAAHLHLIQRHSLRIYVGASELKAAGMDWKSPVLSRCLTGAALEVALLKADPRFGTEEERVRAFVAAGIGSRATYFNWARRLKPVEAVPHVMLSHTERPGPPPPPFSLDVCGATRPARIRLDF